MILLNIVILTLGKTNIGPRVPGWSFRVPDADPPVIQWVGPVDQSADDLIGGKPSRRGPDTEEREGAADWLRELLKNGSKPVPDIQAEARGAGYSWATIRRAKGAIKIVPERAGFGPAGGWRWMLPAMGDHRCSNSPNTNNLSTYEET